MQAYFADNYMGKHILGIDLNIMLLLMINDCTLNIV